MGQVVAKKLIYTPSVYAGEGNALLFQPAPEVFDDLNAELDSRRSVTMSVKSRRETLENYVKVTGSASATDRYGLDGAPRGGGIGKTLRFHRFRQLSSYPQLQPNTIPN